MRLPFFGKKKSLANKEPSQKLNNYLNDFNLDSYNYLNINGYDKVSNRSKEILYRIYQDNSILTSIIPKMSSIISSLELKATINNEETKESMSVLNQLKNSCLIGGFCNQIEKLFIQYFIFGRVYFCLEVNVMGGIERFDVLDYYLITENYSRTSHSSSDNFHILYGDFKGKYEYSSEDNREVYHFTEPPVDNKFVGCSKIIANIEWVNAHNSIAVFNHKSVKEYGGDIYVTGTKELESMSIKERSALQRIINENATKNKGKIKVIPANLNVSKVGSTPRDMEFATLARSTVREICNAYNYPTILYSGEGSTFNNQEQAELSLYEDTLIPVYNKFLEQISNIINKKTRIKNLKISVDTSKVLRIQQKFYNKINPLVAGVNGSIITQNEAREKLGLPPADGGDEFLFGANMPMSDFTKDE